MKKLLLVISLLIPFLYSPVNVDVKAQENDNFFSSEQCSEFKNSVVKIVNNYDVFSGNGFVYKTDDDYMYIVTTSKILNRTSSFRVIYYDNEYRDAVLLGYDANNEIAVFKTDKVENVTGVCFADSNYSYVGQTNYLYGYSNKENDFFMKTYLNKKGYLHSTNNYINVYKNIIQLKGNDVFSGVGVFDKYNRLVGMISGYNDDLLGHSFVVESNKVIKIVDSIVKTGNYNINYIKYRLVDYGNLSISLKKSYRVSDKVDSGVVVVTFKPLKYIFGGLNQGMVIVAVNGVDVKNGYELDKQLMRYDKNSKLCFKVIKSNGKQDVYYLKV